MAKQYLMCGAYELFDTYFLACWNFGNLACKGYSLSLKRNLLQLPSESRISLYTAKYGWFDSVLLKPGYSQAEFFPSSNSK